MQGMSELINIDIDIEDEPLRVTAYCLKTYLEVHGKQTNAFSVLHFLAD